MSEQVKEAVELKVLTDQVEIDKVKRLINRVAFSIFYRRRNVQQHEHELKAVEKIQRFLSNESHESYAKSSKLWISMGQTVAQHIDQINKVIEEAKDKDKKEFALLESIKEHTYGEGLFDHDYFKSILPYAEVNGDTDEFNTMLKAMMRESGFLATDNIEPIEGANETVNAEPIEENVEEAEEEVTKVKE